ncbi:MAG: hypothetical protein JRJ85_17505, partial [Deltaproteobacteria bacterium]|nr:hypothetical protein [Deltaproteobacteria bacterium]
MIPVIRPMDHVHNVQDVLSKAVHQSHEGEFQYWRERIFSYIFFTIALLGVFIYIPGIIFSIKLKLWNAIVIDTVLYFAMLTIVIFKQIPYNIRAPGGLLICFVLGLMLLVLIGPVGPGLIWLFTFSSLSGVLLGLIPALIALGFNSIVIIVIGIVIDTKTLGWETLANYSVGDWIITGINFIFLNTMVAISLALLFHGLKESLEKEESITAKLDEEHQRLMETYEKLNREMHERRQAEKEKVHLEARLQQAQKMESIGTLAGGIAHDFNNILYPIIGFSELTMRDLPEGSRAKRNLNEIFIAANRAKSLVTQILRFSRMENPDFKPFNIQEVVRESLEFIRASVPTIIEIRRDIEKDCSPVMGDSTQIHQVVMNLCTNAYHAMEKTGGRLDVELKELGDQEIEIQEKVGLSSDRFIRLTIRDTGMGMDKAILDRIFDPYFTTKEQG